MFLSAVHALGLDWLDNSVDESFWCVTCPSCIFGNLGNSFKSRKWAYLINSAFSWSGHPYLRRHLQSLLHGVDVGEQLVINPSCRSTKITLPPLNSLVLFSFNTSMVWERGYYSIVVMAITSMYDVVSTSLELKDLLLCCY